MNFNPLPNVTHVVLKDNGCAMSLVDHALDIEVHISHEFPLEFVFK